MNDIIHLLPDAVANQIAAGEVIQRPASVLKELVENAIDAGADAIQIVMKDAGRTLIQVTDNGKGMSDTDARMAFERHATSKIQDARDLFSIRTMGFRGEALASIAAVAQVEMRSRREEDELGTLVEIAGSSVSRQEVVQCQQGTSFAVKNLFFNVPARRRFLKSDSVEKSHLLNEFYRIVLVHPDVEFSLYDGDDEVFHLPVANNKVRIDQVFGNSKKKLNQQLVSIGAETGIVNIKGFIGRPEFAQKSAHQYFFVNGRYMRHPYFHKAVMMAYNQLIQPSDNPHYFIYFEVDPQTIDINIHPTKTEIKFESEQAIWSILSSTVKEALGKFNIIPSIDFDREGVPDIPVRQSDTVVTPPKTSFNPNYNPFGGGSYKRPVMEWDKLYQGFEQQTESKPEDTEPEDHQTAVIFQSRMNPEYENSGQYFQFKNRYIITSVKSGMLIVDQHRAHIRILFDGFLREIQEQKGVSQQLLFPEELELMPGDVPFFGQIRQELRYLGFEVEEEKAGSYMIKGMPSQLKSAAGIVPLLHEMVAKVKSATGDPLSALHEQIALALAETAAIPAGQPMTIQEMTELVEQLFGCAVHNHTPDGKIVMTILSQDEIQARFKL